MGFTDRLMKRCWTLLQDGRLTRHEEGPWIILRMKKDVFIYYGRRARKNNLVYGEMSCGKHVTGPLFWKLSELGYLLQKKMILDELLDA